MDEVIERWVIKTISYETEKVVKTSEPMSQGRANKVQSGMDINLDHDKYFTVVEELGSV